MITKVMIGQRWHHIYKLNQVYYDSIVEIVGLLDTGRPKCRIVQVIESTNNDDEVCQVVGHEFEAWSIPYGNVSNNWEFLENQEAPNK